MVGLSPPAQGSLPRPFKAVRAHTHPQLHTGAPGGRQEAAKPGTQGAVCPPSAEWASAGRQPLFLRGAAPPRRPSQPRSLREWRVFDI